MLNPYQYLSLFNQQIFAADPTVNKETNYRAYFTLRSQIIQNSVLLISLPSEVSNVSSTLSVCKNEFDLTESYTCTLVIIDGVTTVKVMGMINKPNTVRVYSVTFGPLWNSGDLGMTDDFTFTIVSPDPENYGIA